MRGGPTAEREPAGWIIVALMSVGFLVLLVVPDVDQRFAWSRVPTVAGDLLVVFGWIGIYFVLKENTFAAATIMASPD